MRMTREDKDARLFGEPEPKPERPPGKVPAGPRSDIEPEQDWIRQALQRGY